MQTVRPFPFPLTTAAAERRARTTISSRVIIGVALVLLMLGGGWLRFTGLNWDDYTHLHPDERFLTGVAILLNGPLNLTETNPALKEAQLVTCLERYPDTRGRGTFFDARCSTLNPHNAGNGLYVYGTLPLFIARGAAELFEQISEPFVRRIQYPGTADPVWATYDGYHWLGYQGIHLVWRFMSAIAEMGVIVLVFCIGVKLHDKWIGLLAAALYTFTVFSIQQSHFGTVDAISNFFATACVLAAACVYKSGSIGHYIGFGVMFGATLACRINLAPLAGLIVLAAGLRLLPTFDRRAAGVERDLAWLREPIGLVAAGVIAVIVFRLANPYAFVGPGIFGLDINQKWLNDLGTAQALVSGIADVPPNRQWVSRAEYLFPLQNMVLWGMGAPLGLAAWGAFVWATWRILRGRPGALANVLLVAWITVYFGWLGRNWVTTMRYFLPIYPTLIVLAAWGLMTLARGAPEAIARMRRLPRAVGWVALVGVLGFTILWAGMFTNIYRHQFTSVQANHWVRENMPSDFRMILRNADGSPVADALPIDIGVYNNPFPGTEADLASRVTRLDEMYPIATVQIRPQASGFVTTIEAPHLGDPYDDPEPETLRFLISVPGSSIPLATATLETDLSRVNHVIGDAYTITWDRPVALVGGQTYDFTVAAVAGAPVISGGSIVTWEGDWDEPIPVQICQNPPGVTSADRPPPDQQPYPTPCIAGTDPWGALYNGYKLNIVYEDDEIKRQSILRTLNDSDVLLIHSNRFYDTLNRNPARFPLSNAYYEKLFAGELGWEIVATFQETFELGPLRISDQVLPTFDVPSWLNEFEAEEAFHVYDHPVVFVLQKKADYEASLVFDFLYNTSITRSNEALIYRNCPEMPTLYYCDATLIGPVWAGAGVVSSDLADQAQTQLRFSPDMRAVQAEGGTWADRFDRDSLINTQPVLTVAAWWAAIVVFGWAAFPMLFAAFPALADRGYSFAKFAGMFLAAWATWFLASLQIPVWTRWGVVGALVVILVIGLTLALRHRDRRAEWWRWLRLHWRRLLIIEILTLALFGVFLAVRLNNPDLWHPSYGGEKPMDFAYFNGVLRSTIFPPIDPWNAGGYINYYYFGFVIVGAPTLVLGVVPSVAYNLILPTLFAATGIGAFSVAFNLVSAMRERWDLHRTRDRRVEGWRRLGSPWVAGIVAIFLAVFLGNLDTPRVFVSGIVELGGYTPLPAIETWLAQEMIEGGAPADPDSMGMLYQQVSPPSIGDQLRYEAAKTGGMIRGFAEGLRRMIAEGRQPLIGAQRWFWDPTRAIDYSGAGGNAINEMPYFTFLYGDLHAHMISMPLQLLVMAFVLHEILIAPADPRGRGRRLLAFAIGAIAVGMLRATNTWDWITYLAVSGLAVTLAWWLRSRKITRRTLLSFAGWVGGFVAVTFIAVMPYTAWFATTYSRANLWTGGKTPLWAYFDVHGLFLFLIVSMLLWETARWFRMTRVRTLRGQYLPLVMIGGAVLGGLLLAVGLALFAYPVAIVVIPLLIWIALLFFRDGQTRPMQVVLALSGVALALTLAVEIVVLAGDIGRQNTLFKFYLQAWLMMSVVGGAAFAWLVRGSGRWGNGLRTAWGVIAIVLIGIAALYPLMATRGKSVFRFDVNQPITLDGAAFMLVARQYEGSAPVIAEDPARVTFALADDYAMIRWMQDNVTGSPVIVEGMSEREYLWSGRMSIHTGLPSVIGWSWHQRQQRGLNEMGRLVESRVANVNALYATRSPATAWTLLRAYNVEYLVVGNLERAYYPTESLIKFEQLAALGLLDVVYEVGQSRIYRVNQDAQPALYG